MTFLKACGNCIWYSRSTQEWDASWVIVLNNISFLVFLCLTYKFNLMLSHCHLTKWCNNEKSLFIHATKHQCILLQTLYPLFNKNQAAWNFLSPELEVRWHTVAILIRIVLFSPYLCIRGVSLSSIHYNQSCPIYINQGHQYINLIWG